MYTSTFMGAQLQVATAVATKAAPVLPTQALFGSKKGGTVVKKGTVKKAATAVKTVKKAAPSSGDKRSPSERQSGPDRPKFLPGITPPAYLDGSMIGDYGYDILGLAAPKEFLQVEVDGNDINAAVSAPGDIIGTIKKTGPEVEATPFQPYAEVFSLERFRETELINGRWAMLGVAGALAGEMQTGINWVDIGKVMLEQGSSFGGLPLPWTMTQLVIIEVILVGWAEILRNNELDLEKRLYPGGPFDPFGFSKGSETKLNDLKLAELKHARLGMMASLGFAVQYAYTGDGPIKNLADVLIGRSQTIVQ